MSDRLLEAVRALRRAAEAARRAGRPNLGEADLFPVLDLLGWETPRMQVVEGSGRDLDLGGFPGDRVVVKRLDVARRTESGAVRVVPRTLAAVRRSAAELGAGDGGRWAVQALIEHDHDPGGELLLAARWSGEFGAVVTLGPGGVGAEPMASLTEASGGVLHLSPSLHRREGDRDSLAATLAEWPLAPLVLGTFRGRAHMAPAVLAKIVGRFLRLVEVVVPSIVLEVELNPLVIADGGPMALDALARLTEEEGQARRMLPGAGVPSPVGSARRARMDALLHPASVAVVGVSTGENPGVAILRNLLAMGFPPEAVRAVKEGQQTLEGCACVPDVAALDPGVDLLVVSVPAREVPPLLEQVVLGRRARSVVLVSGGFGDGGANEGGVEAVRRLLKEAGDEAPVVNGGNCLGIRSHPGRLDTLFIPRERIDFPAGPPQPVAVISQSGAFALARVSAIPWLHPRYVVTVGNQLDLTVGEYLEVLADDPDTRVFACYVEAFSPLDGLRFLRAARRLAREGRPVVLYRAGRTARGAKAAATHTASVAGDYGLTRALAGAAGVLVADSLEDFEDLVRMATLLDGRTVGRRLGAMSNAGFECVALADGAGGLRLARLSRSTAHELERLTAGTGLEEIVTPRNPLDVTPSFDDGAFLQAARTLLTDDGVDVGVIGCVPLTPTLRSPVDRGGSPPEVDLTTQLPGLLEETLKAWVSVVDGGPAYDDFANALERAGVPTFRRGDQAVRALARYARWRMDPYEKGSSPV